MWPTAVLDRMVSAPPDLTAALVERALSGDPDATRTLVRALMPVVHARVGRSLAKRAALARGGDVRQRIDDLVQDVFVELFRVDGRLLRTWDPARGLSLRGFVGLVAEQRVAATLRCQKRSPWTEDPTLTDVMDREPTPEASQEERFFSRETLELILDRARVEMSPLGLRVFQLLVVEQRSVEEVGRECGMTPATVHAWQSRLRRLLRRIAAEVDAPLAEPGRAAE